MDLTTIKKTGRENGWETVIEESDEKLVLGSAAHRAHVSITNSEFLGWGACLEPYRLHERVEAFVADQYLLPDRYSFRNEPELARILSNGARLAKKLRFTSKSPPPGASSTRAAHAGAIHGEALQAKPTNELLSPEILQELKLQGAKKKPSQVPLVKLFNPIGPGVWYLTFIKNGYAYGFADLGQGLEFGPIDLEDLASIKIPIRIPGIVAGEMGIERDQYWNPKTMWDAKNAKPTD